MDAHCKEKERVWTTDSMRQQCNNWSLEADAELLKHLQQFSQNLLLETHTTLKSLDALESQLNSTNVKLNTVSNSFMSLSDSQFVENRVYEDEETNSCSAVNTKTVEDVSNNKEKDVIERLTEALKNGIIVLNEKFEVVKLPESDSEGEEDDSSVKSEVVLKLKNPYEDLVLPYLIGSHEFNTDDTLGIGEIGSEDEAEEFLSDKDLESEDSEPESDQAKVHQTFGDNEPPNLTLYKQTNLAERLSLHLGMTPHPDEYSGSREGSIGSYTDNISTRKISFERASIRKEASNDGSALSSASSSEYVDGIVGDINEDVDIETEDLFESTNAKTYSKVFGGVKVMDEIISFPSEESQIQPMNSKGKLNPKEILQRHNQILKSRDQESLFEDIPARSNVIESSKSRDSDGFFSQTDQDCSNIPTSNINKKSFLHNTQRNVIDDHDNSFDNKNIFLDDDDDEVDFLFNISERMKNENKKEKHPEGSQIFSAVNPSVKHVPNTDSHLFSDGDIFSSPEPLRSNAFGILADKVPNIENKNKTSHDNLFDDWDDDDDDLFKEILPKTVMNKKETNATKIQISKEDTKLKAKKDESSEEKLNRPNSIKFIESTNENPKATLETKVKANSIDFFNDDDGEDINDLFSNPESKPNLFVSTKPKVKNIFEEKSWFDDSGSDDDLFSTTVKTPKSPESQSNLSKISEAINSDCNTNFMESDKIDHLPFGETIFEDVSKPKNNSYEDNKNDLVKNDVIDKSISKLPNGIISSFESPTEIESILDKVPEPLTSIVKSGEKRNVVVPNKIQLPKSLDIKHPSENNEAAVLSPDTPDGGVISSPRPSTGKLNTDLFLNIDPKTMLPGSKPKYVKPTDTLPSDSISVLQNVVKERPKIQVKRRPPTRKARHEALRVSKLENNETNSDLSEANKDAEAISPEYSPIEDNFPDVDNKLKSLFDDFDSSNTELTSNNKLESNFSISNVINNSEMKKTEEDTLPQPSSNSKLTKSVTEEVSILQAKTKVVDEWLDSENEDDFLFAPNISKSSSSQANISTIKSSATLDKSKNSLLFEESDTLDSELTFPAVKDTNINKILKQTVLFDDEDDDDLGIFNSGNTSTDHLKPKYFGDKLGTQSRVVSHSTQKVKLSAEQVFTDPLMSTDNVE